MVPLADDLVSFDYILLNQTPDKTSLDCAIFTRTLTAWNLCGWLWPLWHLVLCISQFVFCRVCRRDSVLYLCFCEALQALGQFLTFSLDLGCFQVAHSVPWKPLCCKKCNVLDNQGVHLHHVTIATVGFLACSGDFFWHFFFPSMFDKSSCTMWNSSVVLLVDWHWHRLEVAFALFWFGSTKWATKKVLRWQNSCRNATFHNGMIEMIDFVLVESSRDMRSDMNTESFRLLELRSNQYERVVRVGEGKMQSLTSMVQSECQKHQIRNRLEIWTTKPRKWIHRLLQKEVTSKAAIEKKLQRLR